MKKGKILLNISNLNDIEKYKKLGISNFLFPLKDYSIGYTSFTLEEISNFGCECYILANRLLKDTEIDEFLKLNIPKNIKGFIIEDTGLYYALKDKEYELINFQNHLNNNYITINYWLKYFTSVVISTDITSEEIEKILKESSKPLILNTVGYPMIMYSRRHLVSNFYKNLKEPVRSKEDVVIPNTELSFKFVESEYGTVAFDKKIIDLRQFAKTVDESKIKFFLFNTEFMVFETVEQLIKGNTIENSTTGFLDKKTIYKVGDI